MPPALLSAVFGGTKTEHGVKNEYRYDDYDNEVQEIGDHRRNSGGYARMMDERVRSVIQTLDLTPKYMKAANVIKIIVFCSRGLPLVETTW